MKYLCLGYLDVEKFDAVPMADRNALMEKCYAQCIPFRDTGKVVIEAGLHHTNEAKSIRLKGGQQIFTDGPFTETNELLGSFFIVEADSMEEALQVAALHPGALFGEEYGFGIEVRAIRE